MNNKLKNTKKLADVVLLGLSLTAFSALAQVDILVTDSCVSASEPIVMKAQMLSSCSSLEINWYKNEAASFVPASQYSDIEVNGVNLTTMSNGEYKVEATCDGNLPVEKSYVLDRNNCM